MSVWKYAREKFGIPLLHQQAKQLLKIHGISEKDYELANAIEHSYTSAMLQWRHGQRAPNLARALGHSQEYRDQLDHDFFFWNSKFKDQPQDGWRDLWNNEIGRQIGEYVRRNGLSHGDLEDLIKQAYDRADDSGLIKSFSDPRIPPKPSGWPGNFRLKGTRGAPEWGGPDSGWTPSGGPGLSGNPPEPLTDSSSLGRNQDSMTPAYNNRTDRRSTAPTFDERWNAISNSAYGAGDTDDAGYGGLERTGSPHR